MCQHHNGPPTQYKIKLNNCKLINLVIKIQLTLEILMQRFSNFLKNSTFNFHRFLYLVTCFLRVTVLLLCRSQCRTISSPFTFLDRDKLEHVSLIQLVTDIATKPWLPGNMLPNIKHAKIDDRISKKIWESWH